MRAATFCAFTAVLALCTVGCRDESKIGLIGTFGMGEPAQVGGLSYTVADTQWALTLGSGPTMRIPTNRFLLIKLIVLNGGGSAGSTVPSFSLIDDTGKAYQEAGSGEGLPDWMGFVRRVNPSESKPGTILFDVPQKRFKLRVADETDRNYAFINIPLTLGEAPPDVAPVPGR